MFPTRLLLAATAILGVSAPVLPQIGPRPAPRVAPRLEPVAETRLLMEGLAHANFRGLERQLAERPREGENWTFARGQALLIAETANLLLIRPPRGNGQEVWMERATDLRDVATTLARHAAARDFDRSQKGLVAVANACNRCHQTFRIPTMIVPFEETKR